MYYVYAYCDPRTKLPFYIGKGKGRRDRQHLGLCHNGGTHFYHKLNKMLSEGVTPQIVRVFEGGERACLQVEQTLIQSYGRTCEGGPLCNIMEGGNQPPSWKGKKHSKATREKMSKVSRTKEWRAKIAEANTKRKLTTKTKDAIGKANSKAVEAFDIETGKVLHSFKSCTEASKHGFNLCCVSQVACGNLKTHKGLGWRYI